MLEFLVYDKANAFKQVAVPDIAHVELLNNDVSFADLTFDDDNRVWGNLGHGARVAVRWDGVEKMRGPLVKRSGTGPLGQITAHIEDDWRMFAGLGWPKPSAAISAQTDAYKRYTGTTEDVVKAACGDYSTRRGLGWTIPASTHLGSTQRVEFRFHPLIELLQPLVNADVLSWTIRTSAGAVTVDVQQKALFSRILTPDTGVLGDYTWSETAPLTTDVVVGDSGDDTSRLFKEYTTASLETEWGFRAESFADARLANGVTDLSPDGNAALADGAPKVSVSTELIENDWFRFGTYDVGSRLRIQFGTVDVTQPIARVVIDQNPDDGLVVVPSIGELDDDPDVEILKQVSELGRSVRDQRRR